MASQEELLSKIKADFKETYDLMTKRYNNLFSKYEDLRGLFESRPSREEDIKTIERLTEELKQKATQMMSYEENMEFYKNQLINMDETYTKYFGNTHKIGNMNPLEVNKAKSFKTAKGKGFNLRK